MQPAPVRHTAPPCTRALGPILPPAISRIASTPVPLSRLISSTSQFAWLFNIRNLLGVLLHNKSCPHTTRDDVTAIHFQKGAVVTVQACAISSIRFRQSARLMPAKRKMPTGQYEHNAATSKRIKNAAAPAQHATRPDQQSSSLPATTSIASTARWSDWMLLPTELLSLIASYSFLHVLLHIARVNRRLHQLVHEPASDVPEHVSMWRHYPPITVVVVDQTRVCCVDECVVVVGGGRFGPTRSSSKFVSSLTSLLRHTTSLHLDFDCFDSIDEVPLAIFSVLQHFKQLRVLEVRDAECAASALAAALCSLPSLVSLELIACRVTESGKLAAALHGLCSTRLDHLSLNRRQLYSLVHHQPQAAMTRLRSLTVTHTPRVIDQTGRRIDRIRPSSIGQFPSLQHLTLHCGGILRSLESVQLPQLSSFTVHGVMDADLLPVDTRVFRLSCSARDGSRQVSGIKMCHMLTCSPHMRQLVIEDDKPKWTSKARSYHLFPEPSAVPASLSQLTYLELLVGLQLVDLHYLLNTSSPPSFAAQLTHLALGVQYDVRAAAATLLPSLPVMYSSLTHLHVGRQSMEHELVIVCALWDAAIQAVRTAVGGVWCEEAWDVVACREDVAWRRSVGLPVELEL